MVTVISFDEGKEKVVCGLSKHVRAEQSAEIAHNVPDNLSMKRFLATASNGLSTRSFRFRWLRT